MCTGHDSPSVHPKESKRREERWSRERDRKCDDQEKTEGDKKEDGREEKQRDNKKLYGTHKGDMLQHLLTRSKEASKG